MTGAGRVFLGDADGDGGAVQRHLPSGARPSPPLGGEETQAGDVAGDDGASDCQSSRHGRHRHDALRPARRTDHAPATGARRSHATTMHTAQLTAVNSYKQTGSQSRSRNDNYSQNQA